MNHFLLKGGNYMKTELKSLLLTNGETLGYREREGGKEVLLLIHGNMTSSKHWDILIDALDPKYKIYAVDMRGFGISSYNRKFDSLKELCDDIKLFVDKLNLKKFSIMGWSTGGGVAMHFAANYPDYIKKMILLESVGTRGYPIFKKDASGRPIVGEYIKTKQELENDLVQVKPILVAYQSRNKEVLKAIWNGVIYNHNQPPVQKYEEYLEDMLTQRNLVDIDYSLQYFNISNDFNGVINGTGEAAMIKCPVLIIWGKNDLVVPEYMALDIKKDIGENAELVYLEGCGHSPLIDNLGLLVRTVQDFLA